MTTDSSIKTPKLGRPRTKPLIQCKSCGSDIPTRFEIDGVVRPAYGRTYCFSCVPLGTKKRKHLDLSKEGQRQDLLGKLVGNWTLVGEGPRYGKAQMRTYVCRCTCGFERTFPVSYINTGIMGCCSNCRDVERELRLVDAVERVVGTRTGTYTVVSYKDNNKYGTRMWCCRCDCGTEVELSTSQLNSSGRLSCRNCYNEKQELDNRVLDFIPPRFWKRLLDQAKSRNIPVTIGKEDLFRIFCAQGATCALTAKPIWFSKFRTNFNRYTTASVDRIDSNRSYEVGNVQWVHKKVNRMKGTLTQEEFIDLCHEISKNRK